MNKKIKQIYFLNLFKKNRLRLLNKPNINIIEFRLLKLVQFLFFYRSKFRELAIVLSKLLNKNIEIELVPLLYPYNDSFILSQFIGINSKQYTFDQINKTIFNKSHIQSKHILHSSFENSYDNTFSSLNGIKIKLAGRLLNQKIIPRKTIKTRYKGTLLNSKTDKIQSAIFNFKNKRGAYSIKI